MKKLAVLSLPLLIMLVQCSKIIEEQDEFATITFFVGEVKKNDADVQIGDILKENDVILTGANSSCDLKIGDSMIRIKENSKLLVSQILRKEKTENVMLGLDVGKMLCRPKKLMKNESFFIKTPTAVAGVRGTLFTVEADKKKTTRIKVYNGKVSVARRIETLEKKVGVDRIVESGSSLEQNQKVVITEAETKAAEVKVEKAIAALSRSGSVDEESLLRKARPEIAVDKKNVSKFKAEDFTREKEEIIAVERKTPEVVKAIRKIIRREKEEPMPDGSLLVTRYDFYFIKNGKVEGEWKVIGEPVTHEDKIYIASRDYVFCASVEGPLRWRRKIQSDGKIELRDNSLSITTPEGRKKLDLKTGEFIE